MGVSGAPGIFSSVGAFSELCGLGLKFTSFSQFIGGFSLRAGPCTDSWPLKKYCPDYGVRPREGRAINFDLYGASIRQQPAVGGRDQRS